MSYYAIYQNGVCLGTSTMLLEYDDSSIKVKEITEKEYNKLEDVRKKRNAIVSQIEELKAELCTYDYIGTKIAMGVATKEDYAKEIAYTETLRQQIRKLESEV